MFPLFVNLCWPTSLNRLTWHHFWVKLGIKIDVMWSNVLILLFKLTVACLKSTIKTRIMEFFEIIIQADNSMFKVHNKDKNYEIFWNLIVCHRYWWHNIFFVGKMSGYSNNFSLRTVHENSFFSLFWSFKPKEHLLLNSFFNPVDLRL